jgi:hypothetical protein
MEDYFAGHYTRGWSNLGDSNSFIFFDRSLVAPLFSARQLVTSGCYFEVSRACP